MGKPTIHMTLGKEYAHVEILSEPNEQGDMALIDSRKFRTQDTKLTAIISFIQRSLNSYDGDMPTKVSGVICVFPPSVLMKEVKQL